MADRITTEWGYLEFSGNELQVVSTVADPPKVRLAAAEGGSLGAVSWNRLRPDGGQVEMVLLQGKQDERQRGATGDAQYAGEVTIHLNNGGQQDANMVRVCEIRSDGVRFDVPVRPVAGFVLSGGQPLISEP